MIALLNYLIASKVLPGFDPRRNSYFRIGWDWLRRAFIFLISALTQYRRPTGIHPITSL